MSLYTESTTFFRVFQEFGTGFRGLRSTGFTTQSASAIKRMPLQARRAWLRHVQAHRARRERQLERNHIPEWVRQNLGIVEWKRRNELPDPTDEIIQTFGVQFPALLQYAVIQPDTQQEGTEDDGTENGGTEDDRPEHSGTERV